METKGFRIGRSLFRKRAAKIPEFETQALIEHSRMLVDSRDFEKKAVRLLEKAQAIEPQARESRNIYNPFGICYSHQEYAFKDTQKSCNASTYHDILICSWIQAHQFQNFSEEKKLFFFRVFPSQK